MAKYCDDRLEIRIPKQLKERLSLATSASGLSMADLVRGSIIRGLEQIEQDVKSGKKSKKIKVT